MTTEASGIIVTMEHVRIASGCGSPRQVKNFLERHGLSAKDFFRNGLPVEIVEAFGDEMAMDIARVARGQQ